MCCPYLGFSGVNGVLRFQCLCQGKKCIPTLPLRGGERWQLLHNTNSSGGTMDLNFNWSLREKWYFEGVSLVIEPSGVISCVCGRFSNRHDSLKKRTANAYSSPSLSTRWPLRRHRPNLQLLHGLMRHR